MGSIISANVGTIGSFLCSDTKEIGRHVHSIAGTIDFLHSITEQKHHTTCGASCQKSRSYKRFVDYSLLACGGCCPATLLWFVRVLLASVQLQKSEGRQVHLDRLRVKPSCHDTRCASDRSIGKSNREINPQQKIKQRGFSCQLFMRSRKTSRLDCRGISRKIFHRMKSKGLSSHHSLSGTHCHAIMIGRRVCIRLLHAFLSYIKCPYALYISIDSFSLNATSVECRVTHQNFLHPRQKCQEVLHSTKN